MSDFTSARPSSPAPTADLAGKYLCINHFRTGSCRGPSCRGIHLPDAARHSALREAAVKPAASDRVFSLDDVRTVVRQELFSAHRGRGRRGNGSERRKAKKQKYWVAEKKRRRQQAFHERVRRRDCVFFRVVSRPVQDVSVLFNVWRSRAHLSSLLCVWRLGVTQSVRSAALARGFVAKGVSRSVRRSVRQPPACRSLVPDSPPKRRMLREMTEAPRPGKYVPGFVRKNTQTVLACCFCGFVGIWKVVDAHEVVCIENPLVAAGVVIKEGFFRSPKREF